MRTDGARYRGGSRTGGAPAGHRSPSCYGNEIVTDRHAVDPGDPFAALGDPHRRRILALLADAPRSVGALALELPISRPAVSRHLRLLKDAGLVEEEAHGTRRIYRLRDDGVRTVQRYLADVWGEAAARFRLVAENTRPPSTPGPGAPP
jgi:DNA-binding transcriptional ArsR family regulator